MHVDTIFILRTPGGMASSHDLVNADALRRLTSLGSSRKINCSEIPPILNCPHCSYAKFVLYYSILLQNVQRVKICLEHIRLETWQYFNNFAAFWYQNTVFLVTTVPCSAVHFQNASVLLRDKLSLTQWMPRNLWKQPPGSGGVHFEVTLNLDP